MITSWDIYWLTRLNPIGTFAGMVGVLGTLASIFITVGHFVMKYSCMKSEQAASKTLGKVSLVLTLISLLALTLNVMLPNMKEMAAIIVVPKVINAVAQNEDFKQIPTNIVELANDWLKELKPKSK